MIWGTYPTEDATPVEVELSKTIHAAWAGFIKDPWGAGPGWGKVDAAGSSVGCFGCHGELTEATVIDEQEVDGRCVYYEGIYQTVKTPFF